jgi:hypothetical protein
MPECEESNHVEVDSQDSSKDEVKRRIEAAMVLEVLGRGRAHEKLSILLAQGSAWMVCFSAVSMPVATGAWFSVL